MFDPLKKYGLVLLFSVLSLAVLLIFYIDWHNVHPRLTFTVFNIGQGDAMLIDSPSRTQVLVDAGSGRVTLNNLSQVMSPFDRYIDVLIITNPDQDHIGGVVDILKVYDVGMILESGTTNTSKTYQNLKKEIRSRGIKNILARSGMKVHLGDGAFIEILFPDRDVSLWERNDGSVVAMLHYGENKILLTGDSTSKTEKIILSVQEPGAIKSDILKVAHHGSRTSSSNAFIEQVSPLYAVISSGEDNSYGHPHKDVLDTLYKSGAQVLRTDILGTIIFSCAKMEECEIKK